MNENIALWIIQASITAAGLIFLVYGAVFPVLSRLLRTRAEVYLQKDKELSKKELTQIDEWDLSELKKLTDLPWWMSVGLIGTFALYLLSALLGAWFLLGNSPASDNISLMLFVAATAVFIVTGVSILVSIRDLLSKQFQESIQKIKKEQKLKI